MKNINTLIPDIQARLLSGESFDEQTVTSFAQSLAKKLSHRLSEARAKPSLRLSNLGTLCSRKLWYSINQPELAEPLSASTRLKFLFGDILEELILFLARAAGHEVTNEQKEVSVNGVLGHIDGTIDGEPVDVKSASTPSFHKFQFHTLKDDDAFGYLDQLGSYCHALGKSIGHFFAVDKTLGNICLDTHTFEEVDYDKLVDEKRSMLAGPMPERGYEDIAEGASGNRKLGVACSYCAFKQHCWPGVRKFKYGKAPRTKIVYLSQVMRTPDVPELSHEEE